MYKRRNDNGKVKRRRWCCLYLAAMVLLPVSLARAQPSESGPRLDVELNASASALTVLRDDAVGIDWINHPSNLFDLHPNSSLEPRLTIERVSAAEVEFTLTLHNPTDHPITADVRFPLLQGLGGEDVDAGELNYCFPRQDLVLGSEPVNLDAEYSGRFPLQFLATYSPGRGGVYLLTCDTEMHRKRYFLQKKDRITMGATYPGVEIGPGQTMTLPKARIGVCDNDWHGGFDAYRRWVRTWHTPTVPRKDWFRRVFSFRQVFLYPNLDTPGLYGPATRSFNFQPTLERDIERFGGVDYLHIFDWSQTPEQGRVGMYDPWGYFSRDRFVQAVEQVQRQGIPVGLYLEGYLVSPAATIPGRPGRAWQLLDRDGRRYDPFGSGDDYLCPGVRPWRDHLTQAVLRAKRDTAADGYYIDQFGFGYQYPCYDPSHNHAIPSNQVRLESKFIEQIRKQLPPEQILYTEQTPVDGATQFQDGSFSYATLHSRHPQAPTRVNLARFAFPDFKIIQILRGDGPIGDDAIGVKLVFFNGDGLWLVGPSDHPKWYSPQVLETIRKTHRLKHQYSDAFTSSHADPLVPTMIPGVYANCFQGKTQTGWTLYNSTNQAIDAAVIKVHHVEGAQYFDAWNEREIQPVIEDGYATVSLPLNANDVGFLVQLLEK